MHPAIIKAALKISGYTQTMIAEDCGVTPVTVGMVISGKGRSARIENRISRLTQLRKHEIWPQWYDSKGNRVGRRRCSNPNALEDLKKLYGSVGN